MTVYIGMIAKNIENSILPLLTFLTEFQTALPDSHVFIYENNSTDETRSYFPILQTMIQNIHIQSETLSESDLLKEGLMRTWDNKPCRMEMIARARNKLLEMIDCHGYMDDDLIIMLDSDMSEPVEIGPLLQKLQNFPKDADAIFANGLASNRKIYYDMYALRYVNSLYGPEIRGDAFWKTIKNIEITERMPVISAFGGLGIYKGYCLKHNSYSAIPTKSLDQLYKSIMSQSGYIQPIPETHHNGALMGMYLFGEGPYDTSHSLNPQDIFYVNNSGYNFPVVCEHSTLHATMIMRGQGRLFIDPDQRYYSNH